MKLSDILLILVLMFGFLTITLVLNDIVNAESFDSLNHIEGTVDSGNLQSFLQNDNNFYNVTETTSTPGLNYELDIENTDLDENKEWSLVIKCFYNGSTGHNMDFQIYDFTTTSWIDLVDIPDSLSITYLWLNFTPGDYVNGDGDINTRIYHSSPGNINHQFGVDYLEIWEQDFSLNDTFNQQVPMVINQLWTNAQIWNSNDYDLTVNETLTINNTGIMNCNDSILIRIGTCIVNNGGLLNLTSNEFEIFNEIGSISFNIDGDINNNNGIVIINTTTGTDLDLTGTSNNLYNLLITASSFVRYNVGFTLDNNLYIDAGSSFRHSSTILSFTVLGDTIINGTLGLAGWTGTFTTNSLTINSGGTYEATSGETIITGENSLGYSLDSIDGTINNNNGIMRINYSGTSAIEFNDNHIYDIEINGGIILPISTGKDIQNNLYINTGQYRTNNNFQIIDVDNDVIINNTGILGRPNLEIGAWNFGNLTVNNGGIVHSTTTILTVTNDVIINSGGLLNCSYGGNHTFGSLVMSSGSNTYLTPFKTTLTSENIGGYAFISNGNLFNELGTIEVLNTNTRFYWNSGTGNPYDLIIDAISVQWNSNIQIDNDLTIDGGLFRQNSVSNSLTVLGETIINSGGTLGTNTWTGTFTTNSLTINSGGTYEATSRETIITGESSEGLSFRIYSGGTINNNNGLVNITTDSASFIRNNGIGEFYDLSIYTGLFSSGWVSELEIENNFYLNETDRFRASSGNDALIIGNQCIINSVLGEGDENGLWNFGNLTVNNGGIAKITNNALTVTNDVIVNSGGLLNCSYGGNHTFGSLTFTGTVHLTPYQTEITSKALSNNAYDNDGILIMPKGIISITYSIGNCQIDSLGITGSDAINDLEINTVNKVVVALSNPTVINGSLWVNTGIFKLNSDFRDLTVLNDVIVNDTLGESGELGTYTFNSLTINSGGTYEATSGETIITGESGTGFALDFDGNLNSNNGLINISSNEAQTFLDIVSVSGNVYDLMINMNSDSQICSIVDDSIIDNDVTINIGILKTAGNNDDITFNGSLIINSDGQLSNVIETGLWTFGSILINVGGTLEATSNKILNNGDFYNYGTFNHNNGNFTHNDTSGDYEGGMIFYDFAVIGGVVRQNTDNVQIINSLYIDTVNYILRIGGPTLFLGSDTQLCYVNGTGTIRQARDNIKIYSYNENYKAKIQLSSNPPITENNGDNENINIKWLEFVSDFNTDSAKIINYNLDGNCIFNNINIDANDNFNLNGYEFIINGTLNTLAITNSQLQNTDISTIIINGFWDINSNVTPLYINNLVVHGEINIKNYSAQGNNNVILQFNSTNNFRNSTGEINISASVLYPTIIQSDNSLNTIDMNNMTDYFLFNVEISNLTNIDTEYITLHGNDLGNLTGLWDFLPPLINVTYITDGIALNKGLVNTYNFSFYTEELSYLHSYNLTITHKATDNLIYSFQYNFSSAVNNTYVSRIFDIAYWSTGDYWYNITVYDTHNKLKDDAKVKDKLYTTKYKVGNDKVGKYDNQSLITKGNKIELENYINGNILMSLDFINTKNETILIDWNEEEDNYKMGYYVELKEDFCRVKIESSSIWFIEETNNFVFNDIYYYDFTDFLWQDSNNYVTVSNLMKTQYTDYYYIDFHNTYWQKDDFIFIDPLSGGVNNNETSLTFSVNGSTPFIVDINYLSPNDHIYTGNETTFNATITYSIGNVTNYIWNSSIDGTFYNGSNPQTTYNLSEGNHIITLVAIDEFGNYSYEDTINYYVVPHPKAKFNEVSISGITINLNGGYVQIANNTIYGYAWRSSVSGTFYNGTNNPISATNFPNGTHIIYLQIKDFYGNWSSEISVELNLTDIIVDETPDVDEVIWYNSDTEFLAVYSWIVIITFSAVMMFILLKRKW